MKKRLMWITVAAALAVCAVVGAALTVNAAGGAASNLGVEMRTKDDIAIFARSHPADLDAVAEYSTAPSFSEPYAPGKMTASSTQSALDTLNLMRYIAGLSADITISPAKTEYAEAAAFVNSLNDKMDHHPVRPSQLSDQKYDELYSMGADGASKSDLVSGWSITQKINLNNLIPHSWFADDDSSNISRVGHRRWLLNPFMKTIGFGLSSQLSDYNGHQWYRFFGAAFVQDEPGSNSNEESFFKDWGGMTVAWPAQVMPVEYFDSSYPWSLSVGYKFDYDNTTVKLVRKSDNKTWQFSQSASDGEFYCDSTAENHGSPAVVVFKPSDLQIKAGDIFEVTVNIAENSNTVKTVSYNVEFFSLTDYVVSDPSETTAPNPPETGKDGMFNGSPAHVDENGNLYIDEINFPDEVFRNYVKTLEGGEDGIFTTEEIVTTTIISSGDYDETDESKKISSLTGIEFFTALTDLYCAYNNITELDVSANTALRGLNCSNNNIIKLNVTANTALIELQCEYNDLKELNVTENIALEDLYCDSNNLTELDVSKNTSLEFLTCDDNNITNLDLSKNTVLRGLNCSYNPLHELDLSANTALQILNCVSNNLSALDVSSNTFLTKIDCRNNNISELDVSANTALTDLKCRNNQLTELDVSANTSLEILLCDNNQLAKLDLSQNTALENLDCSQNHLTELDIANCPNITSYHANFQTCDTKLEITKTTNGKYALDLSSIVSDTSKIDSVILNFRDTGLGNMVYDYDPETGILTFSPLQEHLTITYNYKVPGAEKFTNENFSVSLLNISVKADPNPPETNPPVTEPDPPVTELVDKDDDVTVQYPESDAAYYEDVKLVVEPKESVANDRVSYSIELIKNGKPIKPKSTITIKLPVPKGWDVSTIVVYHVDDNGNREKIQSSISSDGKYVVFTTDHLSIYELATESSAPAETTAAPAETTAAPAETTAAPAETTAKPAETTAAPAETTAAPAETTAKPAETTATPAETTAAPVETTAAPAETTAAPAETTAAPAVTTATPSTGSTAQPPETGDGVGVASALIVTVMCVGAAGIAVFTCSKKRR